MATIKISDDSRLQSLAKLVMHRFRRAAEHRQNFKLDGNVGAYEWQMRCHRMHKKIHEQSELKAFPDMRFYLGVARFKVDGTAAALNDLVAPIIEKPFSISATPVPDLSRNGRDEVKRKLKELLSQKLSEQQLSAQDLIDSSSGALFPEVDQWIKETTAGLRANRAVIERNLTSKAIRREESILADWFIESNWKMAFTDFLRNGLKDLTAYIRGPEMTKRPVLTWRGNQFVREYKLAPSFRTIGWFNAYPGIDSRTANDGEGFTEIQKISRADLTLLRRDSRYSSSEIDRVLDERRFTSRDWLMEEWGKAPNKVNSIWQETEMIDRVLHQGKFSGRELLEGGVSGIDLNEIIDAEVEIVGNRIIRISLVNSPGGMRNVFSCSYRMEDGAQGSSICSILYDSQLRINRLYRLCSKASNQQAGATYFAQLEALHDTDIDGVFNPFEVNPLNSRTDIRNALSMVQPQPTYRQLWDQLLAEVKMTDEISGVSVLNYAAPQSNPGLRTATGMSLLFASAAKQLKNFAYSIDTYVLPPMLKHSHRMVVTEHKELQWAADAEIGSAGLSRLLAKELQEARVVESLANITQAVSANILPREIGSSAWRSYADSLGLPVDEYMPSTDQSTEIAGALASSSPNTPVTIAPSTPVAPDLLSGGLVKGNAQPRLM